jgi:hypothetical protein
VPASLSSLFAASAESVSPPLILAKACAVLEQAGAEFIPDGIHRRRAERPDAATLYEDLRAISLRSAARMLKQESKI